MATVPSSPVPHPGRVRPDGSTLRLIGPSARATAGLLILLLLLSGIVYPGIFVTVAQEITPGTANGSLLENPNGTAYASALLGQNITNSSLFWLRPSQLDYQSIGGSGDSPYGPSDPALVNETLYYIQLYGLSNVSVPLNLVSLSASGLDADITPESALVQVPRVAHYSGLSESFLNDLVNNQITQSYFGLFGPQYVNVIELDYLLISDLRSFA